MLVDGSSYLYRAFHALPGLKSPKTGEPTGAIYGVLNMLRKLATDYKPAALACVFDARGKTFRDAEYAEYKANRTPMPDELGVQVAPLHEAVKALGWPMLIIDGVEADDVIATLAEEAKRDGWRIVISTGDKDFAQLVEPRVTLVNTMSNELLDIEGVKRKFGVPPEKFLDYLTLIGDQIDNIPGIDKVGPKTAAKWIEKYGSLEGVLEHADEITGLAGENLRKMRDWLPKARQLLTIKRDVPLSVKASELTLKGDSARQRELYDRFGFKTWLKEVEGAGVPAAPAPSPAGSLARRKLRPILTEDELKDLLLKIEALDLVGFDTYCVGEEPMTARLVGLSFAFGDEAVYLPLAHEYPGAPPQLSVDLALRLLRPWLERTDCKKVGEDVKLDTHALANHGVRLGGCVHDTLLESYVLEVHEKHELGMLAQRYCGWTMLSYEEVVGKGVGRIPFSSVDIQRATEYAAGKTDCALALHTLLHERIAADEKLNFVYGSIEMPALPVLGGWSATACCSTGQSSTRKAMNSAKRFSPWSKKLMRRPASPSTSARPSRSRRSCSSARSCR